MIQLQRREQFERAAEKLHKEPQSIRRHPKRGSARKHLPSVVLACRRCNSERGAPTATVYDECPVILAERRRLTA